MAEYKPFLCFHKQYYDGKWLGRHEETEKLQKKTLPPKICLQK